VSFVNAGAQETSVVLVVQSTFNAALARGEVPVGLRQRGRTSHLHFSYGGFEGRFRDRMRLAEQRRSARKGAALRSLRTFRSGC
jgi:hypothetical protein